MLLQCLDGQNFYRSSFDPVHGKASASRAVAKHNSGKPSEVMDLPSTDDDRTSEDFALRGNPSPVSFLCMSDRVVRRGHN